jgi:uracil-DNA glycosylase
MSAELEALWERIRSDHKFDHLRTNNNPLVPGRGESVRPRAFIVGEAPGAREALQRKPFVGPSGDVLRQLMGLAGLSEEDCWITNVVKYRPPGNRTPGIMEVLDSQAHLRAEWRIVGAPKVIIPVGATAWRAMAGGWDTLSLSQVAGQVLEHSGVHFCPMFHPAYGMRKGTSVQDLMERHWEQMPELLKEYGWTL